MDVKYQTQDNEGNFITVPPMKELCAVLTAKFEREEKRIAFLEEENNKLKEGIWLDEENKRMKDAYEEAIADANRGFSISEEEEKAIHNWKMQHIQDYHNSCLSGGAIGGSFKYTFIPTSIGIIGTITCACGKEFTFKELD